MKTRRCLIAGLTGVLLVAAVPARAEVILTPFYGKAFGGSTTSSRTTYGGALGFLGGGVFGFEGEFSYVKDFAGDVSSDTLASNTVQSLSANFMIAMPAGQVRVYGTAGASLLRPDLKTRDGFVVVNEDKFGYNLGGGIILYFSGHVGLRGDIRFFRTFGDLQAGELISVGKLDYWRGIGGLTFKF
ncbi:MAG: outer membrane beta-barrel protein [Vicinamibacteria bacterium]